MNLLLVLLADEAPWWEQWATATLWLAGLVAAIGVIVKTPYINRPIKWVWGHLVGNPMAKWSAERVTEVVTPHLNAQDEKLADLKTFVDVARTNQDDIKAALKNIHDCLDRRMAETAERIEKLTAYTEEVLAQAVGAKERIRQLYRALEIPVFETDMHGHCTYVNPAYSKLTGLTVEEAIGEGWVEAIHPEDRTRVFKAWTSATEAAIDFNSFYRSKNVVTSISTDVRASAKPLHDGAGNVVGWVGTLEFPNHE